MIAAIGYAGLRRMLLLSVAALLAAGCFQPELMTPEQLERGYILLLPGVGNTAASMAGIIRGLREAGVDRAIDLDQWGVRPLGTFTNLMAFERNRAQAEQLAAKLADYRDDYAAQPITVIGYSGGGGMAVFIAEALPEEVALDRIILLSPALSPDYDLAPALAHCRRGLVSFYSDGDWFMTGLATQWFGTMDRKHTKAAGSQGFRNQEGELATYDGLTQIAWTPEWRQLGHYGNHFGWLSPRWAREVLAPQVDASFQTLNEEP